jgi:putative ABC transport system permease protein
MFLSAFMLALRAVRRNKLRATLTVLGILIGVMAVVLVTALGDAARNSVTQKVAGLGSNVIMVFPQAKAASGARGAQGSGVRLTMEDGKAILAESTSVKAWAPLQSTSTTVVAEGENISTGVIGSTRSFFEIRDWEFDQGEAWEDSSEQIKERVCVLGGGAKKSLFGGADAIGQSVRIGRHAYRVVGVLVSKTSGARFGGAEEDDLVIVPFSTFKSHISMSPPNYAGMIFMSAASADVSQRAVDQTTEILRQRHHIQAGQDDDFAVRSQAEFLKMTEQIIGVLTVLLMSVAAVSLVVGGIGVMNIMLVSVAERTREIGIRMAIGAQEGDILTQFLIEAVVLSMLGGFAGVLASFGILTAVRLAFGIEMTLDWNALAVAVGTSTIIGLVFGFFPARRAAKLDPIQALRRE